MKKFRHVREINEKRLLASSCLSFRPSACNNSAHNGRIFIKFDMCVFLRKSVENSQISLRSGKNSGYFTWRRIFIYDKISLNYSSNEKSFR